MSDRPARPNAARDGRSPGTHLSAGQLREYLDGEIRGLVAVRYGLHLAFCPPCRVRQQSVTARGRNVATLLELAGTRSGRSRANVPGGPGMKSLAIATLGALMVAVTFAYGPFGTDRITDRSRVKDICCFNLDGGSRVDDGMVTVSRTGEVVDCVVVYEDRAGTGAFAAGDPVRFLSHRSACSAERLLDAKRSGPAGKPGT
jgi:hypothetical protein